MRPSSAAKRRPMHARAPSPQGLNARRCASVASSGWPASQRCGTNSPARGQMAGSRWMAQITVCARQACFVCVACVGCRQGTWGAWMPAQLHSFLAHHICPDGIQRQLGWIS